MNATADPSLTFEDFYFERIPDPEPEDLTMETSELLLDDDLFAQYASTSGLVSQAQLRQARQFQQQLFLSSGSRLNLSEVLVMTGALGREVVAQLQATISFSALSAPLRESFHPASNGD